MKKKRDHQRKRIAFYVQIGSIVQYGKQMADKLASVLDVFQDNKDKVELIWICDKEHEEYLMKSDAELAKGYSDAKEIMKREGIGRCIYRDEASVAEIVEMCDAYYGSESRIALEFQLVEKPVMIMVVEIL